MTDLDGDGSPFGLEFALGTDPNTPDVGSPNNPTFSINGDGESQLDFGVNPDAISFTTYIIEHSTDLGVTDPWEEIDVTGDLDSNSLQASFIDADVLETRNFYRIKVELRNP